MRKRRLPTFLLNTSLVVCIGLFLVPIYWLVKSAFSTDKQLFTRPPSWFPSPPSLDGFVNVWPELSRGLGISLIIALGCVVLTLATALPTAYGLTLFTGRGGEASQFTVLLTLLFPSMMFVLPLYNIFYQVGLLNNVFGLIIADTIYAIPLGVMILFTYLRTLPEALFEAAKMDGASQFDIFLRIVCPLSLPAIATTSIFAFIFGWGDYLFAVTFGAGRGLYPASVAISQLIRGATGVTRWSEVMAGSVLLAIPALIAVIAAQRYVAGGLAAGALK